MKKNLYYKLALLSAAVGLGILFALMLSGAAYPHVLFRIGAPFGLLFVFTGVLLLFVSWLWELRRGIREKQYLWVAFVAVLGILIMVRVLVRSW